MKIHGKIIEGPAEEIIVFPRQSGDICFKAKAVLDYTDFEKACPVPEPPEVLRPGGIKSRDPNDPKYLGQIEEWAEHKSHWMILKSLEATDGLEFESVDMSDPSTWGNFKDELTRAGFSQADQGRLVTMVSTANGLNEAKIEEATQRFLADQEAMRKDAASPSSEPRNTQSGELASA
jgi:hypothetical protein